MFLCGIGRFCSFGITSGDISLSLLGNILVGISFRLWTMLLRGQFALRL